jgi:hypothetical protein
VKYIPTLKFMRMEDDFIKRGGNVGATIAFWLTLAWLALLVLFSLTESKVQFNASWEDFHAATLSIIISAIRSI